MKLAHNVKHFRARESELERRVFEILNVRILCLCFDIRSIADINYDIFGTTLTRALKQTHAHAHAHIEHNSLFAPVSFCSHLIVITRFILAANELPHESLIYYISDF